MITRLTKPQELVEEFNADRERANYWQSKTMAKENVGSKSFDNFRAVYYGESGDGRSKVVEYESPKTGNKWLLWLRYLARIPGKIPEIRNYQVMYRLTAEYMEVLAPTKIVKDDVTLKGVTAYSDHIFQRMTQEDRLGVEITDRKLTIRNFIEVAVTGCIHIGKPRRGKRYDQCICRMPRSFLFGHVVWLSDSYVMHFNTFIPEKNMTPENWRYVKQFAKDADNMSDGEVKEYFRLHVDNDLYND